MPKPIFIIGFPADCPHEVMHRAYKDLDTRIGHEYHVLSYYSHKLEDVSFELYSVNNATDIEIEKLKKIVFSSYEEAKKSGEDNIHPEDEIIL